MGYREDAIPEELPQHPSRDGTLGDDVTIGQLNDGDGIAGELLMRWSGVVNEYAHALSSSPEPPSRFEDSSVEEVRDVPIGECSTDELVALIAWYWYQSGERESLFDGESEPSA
ncbi:hypothetical protein [Halorussus caseinilyticus]|uniref:Uncharacterized protein n=1 Tax=Halorussus caseinilyticus TaxID=3034025 RepID=A0ABD5WQQ4_9EURY|nr:hypothetical protein [Halorussus sp. DT72]